VNYKNLIVFSFIFGLMADARADQEDAGKLWRVSGYGTLGAVHSTNNQADFVRDLIQQDGVGYTRRIDYGMDSLLGVQLDVTPADEFGASVQVVSRRGQSNFKPEITWAFGRYTPNDTVQLRVGRLGFDVYLLADSRNVSYSYQWVRPPLEYFGPLIISYIDGADLVLKAPLGDGVVRAKFYAGKAQETAAVGSSDNSQFSLAGSPLLGTYLEYQSRHWQYRLGYAQLKFNNEFPYMDDLANAMRSPMLQMFDPNAAILAEKIQFNGRKIGYLSVGVAYDNGPLQGQVMLSKLKSNLLGFPPNSAGYGTVSYRLDKWTPYLTYSAIRPGSSAPRLNVPLGLDPGLDQLAGGYRLTAEGQLADQTTVSFGLRYDFAEKMDVKFQVDQIRSKQNLLIRNVQPGWDGRSTLFSVAFDFIF
jgi:hypothetical protein